MRKVLLAAAIALLTIGQTAEARGCRGDRPARFRLFSRSCASCSGGAATCVNASPPPAGDSSARNCPLRR
jgi:hypothetical protein